MASLEDLKKQLEELIHYNIEQDLLDYPFSKQEFAPYVVSAFVKGLNREQVIPDVLKQLEHRIESEKVFNQTVDQKTTGWKSWISKFKFL